MGRPKQDRFSFDNLKRGLGLGLGNNAAKSADVPAALDTPDTLESLTLVTALGASVGDDDFPSVMFQGKATLKSATYREIHQPASAVAKFIALHAMADPTQTPEDSDDTGAGTTATSTLQSDTGFAANDGPAVCPQKVFGLEIVIGLQGAAAGIGQAVITWEAICGVSLAQTIQFRYPASGENGENIKLVVFPGAAVEGRYRYLPAVINPAGVDVTNVEIAARTISIAWTGMPNNTKIDVTGYTISHEDVDLLIKKLSASADGAIRSALLA